MCIPGKASYSSVSENHYPAFPAASSPCRGNIATYLALPICWHGENTELGKSATFLSFSPFPLPLWTIIYQILLCCVCHFSFLFLDYMIFINTNHRSKPRSQREKYWVFACVFCSLARGIGSSKGGLWFQAQAEKNGRNKPLPSLAYFTELFWGWNERRFVIIPNERLF